MNTGRQFEKRMARSLRQIRRARRELQKNLARDMFYTAGQMSTFSLERLQELAVKPEERAAMEKVLLDCERALARSDSRLAKAAVSIQVKRLRRALGNPAVPA